MKEIKEAVEIARRYHFNTEAGELTDTVKDFELIRDMFIDLAERYLAVEAKMPKKWNENRTMYPMRDLGAECRNKAIDDCTLAFTKMLDRERIADLIFDSLYSDETDKHLEIKDLKENSYDGAAGYRIVSDSIADAIIEAITKGE